MRNLIETETPPDSVEERAYLQRIAQLVKIDPYTTGKLMHLTHVYVAEISPYVQRSRAFERQFVNNPKAIGDISDTQVFIRSNMQYTLSGGDLVMYHRWLEAHEELRRRYMGVANYYGDEWKDRIETAVKEIFPVNKNRLFAEPNES